jgi:uncharacterized membrane protein (DUF485 family)
MSVTPEGRNPASKITGPSSDGIDLRTSVGGLFLAPDNPSSPLSWSTQKIKDIFVLYYKKTLYLCSVFPQIFKTPFKMNATLPQAITIGILFTWIGFIGAISFMEAWLKFRAPGVTVAIGLSIGRLVFGALNKVEWVFALTVCIGALIYSRPLFTAPNILLILILFMLLLQTAIILPALDARAELCIRDRRVKPSSLHFWFVGMECLKVICLLATAVILFKRL